jgi:undecaprenyl-diphosphatase
MRRDTQNSSQTPVAKKLSQFRHPVDVAGDQATLMKASGFNTFMARVDAAEYSLCRKLNRGASFAFPRRLFQIASRLGDGVIWYLVLALLPILYGIGAVKPDIIMALTGLLGVALYKLLKRVFVRERPFITHSSINLAMAPLDRYSFPSGHTLHAVSFAWQATVHFPELGWVLVPLAALIAGSRVVLGLHYPTDVLAGAAIGASLATLGCALV